MPPAFSETQLEQIKTFACQLPRHLHSQYLHHVAELLPSDFGDAAAPGGIRRDRAGTRRSTTTAPRPCVASRKSNGNFRTSSPGCGKPRTRPSSTSSWPSAAAAPRLISKLSSVCWACAARDHASAAPPKERLDRGTRRHIYVQGLPERRSRRVVLGDHLRWNHRRSRPRANTGARSGGCDSRCRVLRRALEGVCH
jgi:hypothetical protein